MTWNRLTARESEVLSCLGQGMNNKEIARRLDLAEATVKSHCKQIYLKMEVSGRLQAVLKGQECGYL